MTNSVQVVVQNLMAQSEPELFPEMTSKTAPGHLGRKNDQFSTSCSTESHSQNVLPNFPFFLPRTYPGHLGQNMNILVTA